MLAKILLKRLTKQFKRDPRIGRSCGALRPRRAHGKRPTKETCNFEEKKSIREIYRRDLHIWQKTQKLADPVEPQDEGEHTERDLQIRPT